MGQTDGMRDNLRRAYESGRETVRQARAEARAAEHEPDDALAEEISQLLYRAQVIMIGRGLHLADVYKYL